MLIFYAASLASPEEEMTGEKNAASTSSRKSFNHTQKRLEVN